MIGPYIILNFFGRILKMDRTFLKIGYNTSVQAAGKAISVILSFATIGLLTRYLGTSGYGNFTLVFSYMSFFSVISDFGLQLTIVRELTGKNFKEDLYGTFLWLKIILFFLSMLVEFLFLIFFPYSHTLKIGIIIGGLAVGIGGLSGYGMTIFQSKVRLDLVTFVDVVTKAITVALIFLFIFLKFGFYSIISTVLLGNLVGFAVTWILLRRNTPLTFGFNKEIAKKVMMWSLPVGFTSFFSLMYFKLDTIMLSVIRSSSEVGVYSLAYKILENVIVIWAFYMASVYPLLLRFKGENERKFNKLFKNSFLLALLSSSIIVTTCFMLSPYLINIFGGMNFAGSSTALRIIIFSVPFVFINNIFFYHFIMKKNMYPVIFSLIVSLLFNFLANLAYIPKYGYLAASYITVVTEFLLFFLLLSFTFLRKRHA